MYCFITMLHIATFSYIQYSFLHAKSLLIPYPNVFVESINCILLSFLALNAILLIFSVNMLAELFLNNVYNFPIYVFIIWHTFLCLNIFVLHHNHLLNSYMLLVLLKHRLSWHLTYSLNQSTCAILKSGTRASFPWVNLT